MCSDCRVHPGLRSDRRTAVPAAPIPGDAPGRRGRRVPRDLDPRPVPVDGRPRLERRNRLDRGAERGDLRLPAAAPDARDAAEADHRAVGLPEDESAGPRGGAAVLSQEPRPREAVPLVHARGPYGGADAADRSEHLVSRRIRLAGGLCTRAGRPVAGLRGLTGWRGLADGEGTRPRERQGFGRRGEVGAVLGPVLDEGRQGVLLLALSRAAAGKGDAGGALGTGDLLPSRRLPAIPGSADLRAQGPADMVHRWHGHRGRPLPADRARRGIGQQQPPVLRGPARSAATGRVRPDQADRRGGRRRVRADWQRGIAAAGAVGP